MRLKAAAAGSGPVTRQAAAQFSRDLSDWQRWQSDPNYHDDLRRLPRRIRVGLAKPQRKNAKKVPAGKIIRENVQIVAALGTKQMPNAISQEAMVDLVATDHRKLRGIATALLRNKQEVDELLGDCSLSIVEQIHAGKVRAQTVEQFYAWLHQVVRFSCYKRLKRKKPQAVEYDEDVEYKGEESIQDFNADDDAYRTVGVRKSCPVADDQ